jgi:hypothetical protein
MRTRRRANIEDLRLAVECLPRHTRIAMLQGIAANEIIVGAYSTSDGVCPMLAAHRAGGRTSVISFAKAWDRFAFRDSRDRRSRRATERELRILKAHLEASLLEEDAPTADLAVARAEHEKLLARREREGAQARAAERVRERERDEARRIRTERDRDLSTPRSRPGSVPGPRPGDPDRAHELGARPGWSWTRVVRRYDDYERVLRRLDTERAAAEAPDEREPALSR